ncbi:MAG: S8 family peptidase [Gemmatimonas sp.]|nr:S8 family peptidase [Gemmatimonas sp.]
MVRTTFALTWSVVVKHSSYASAILTVGLLAACTEGPTQAELSIPTLPPAPYIIVLRDTLADVAAATSAVMSDAVAADAIGNTQTAAARAMLVQDEDNLFPSLHAAVVTVTEDQADRLRANPRVLAVEPVQPTSLFAATLLSTSSWALDRLNQPLLPLDGRTTRFSNAGQGVRIAIFDSGIRWTHAELAGRVAGGFDAFTNAPKQSGDVHGHGTLVASLAAGRTYGLASSATLLDVRVMNTSGSGSSLELVRGADWVIAEKKRVAGPMVANLSLGVAGGSAVVDALVDRLRAAGIVVVVAAGNASTDACTVSPARAPAAITVGASANGAADTRAPFSNGGACIDLSAPGAAVPGAGMASDAALVSASGTSMSSPLVAGAAAAYLGVTKTATPDAVTAWLLAESTTGRMTGLLPNTPNRLLTLQRLPGVAAPAPAPTPTPTPTPKPTPTPTPTPTAGTFALTSSCAARVCTIDASVPTNTSAASVNSVVYTWAIGPFTTTAGTNLRRMTVNFGSPGTVTITVTARLGTQTLGVASTVVTLK